MSNRPHKMRHAPNAHLLKNVKLEPGELSKAVKIRGSKEAVMWFATLDWRERMCLIERLFAERP